MLKKVASLCLVLCMAISFMIPGSAKSFDEKISSDTVITAGNINAVLVYLGLDPSKFEASPNAKSEKFASEKITVEDLKKLIENVKNQLPEPISERYYAEDSSSSTSNSVSSLAARGIVVNKTLYHDSVYSTYTITQSCTGTFELGVPGWKSCSGGDASVDSASIVVKISGTPSISTYLSSDKLKVCMNYTIKVTTFIGIGEAGIIPVNTFTHTGSCYWNATEFAST